MLLKPSGPSRNCNECELIKGGAAWEGLCTLHGNPFLSAMLVVEDVVTKNGG